MFCRIIMIQKGVICKDHINKRLTHIATKRPRWGTLADEIFTRRSPVGLLRFAQ